MSLSAPKILLEQVGMVPIKIVGKRTLYVGFEDSLDEPASVALERMNGLEVQAGLVEREALRVARESLSASQSVESRVERVSSTSQVSVEVTGELSRVQPRASSLVRIH